MSIVSTLAWFLKGARPAQLRRYELRKSLRAIVRAGRDASTPAAAVSRAGSSDARTVTGTLASLADLVERAALEAPAVILVGEVVAAAVATPDVPAARSLARPIAKGSHQLGKA